ncbi:hypothetical protein AV530_013858 [Patagioenas fasciata monilis]|uniref:Uncharacterized protein n=1 Tax=Patagioenas fasciata monilis TaxID=372326 RepID=A0A1V4L354_PATFA|nr:hypothetical protein AV530_013858 [Patagioenas fasciata monilis]
MLKRRPAFNVAQREICGLEDQSVLLNRKTIWDKSSGKNLQRDVCSGKELTISEFRNSEMESGDNEQADEVIDWYTGPQLQSKACERRYNMS